MIDHAWYNGDSIGQSQPDERRASAEPVRWESGCKSLTQVEPFSLP